MFGQVSMTNICIYELCEMQGYVFLKTDDFKQLLLILYQDKKLKKEKENTNVIYNTMYIFPKTLHRYVDMNYTKQATQ